MIHTIKAHWPAPTWIHAFTTTRIGGFSKTPYESFNLGMHVEDNSDRVSLNRLKLRQTFNFKHEPIWLNQTHGNGVLEVNGEQKNPLQADGVWTGQPSLCCAILSADCLPLLLCDTNGTLVAAVHCGWRGILGGIIENTVKAMSVKCQSPLLAWLGPAIGPAHFEVGKEVYEPFMDLDRQFNSAFEETPQNGKWLANIYQLAKLKLKSCEIHNIYGGEYCTYRDSAYFYSYRRNKTTGRMATLIWMSSL